MKKLLANKTLKRDRFKLPIERSCSQFKEVDEYRTGDRHYFKASVGKYKKFYVNGQRTRGEAYKACVAHTEEQGYTLSRI